MNDPDGDTITLEYLRRKGYNKFQGQGFIHEAKLLSSQEIAEKIENEAESDHSNIIKFHNSNENCPDNYDKCYCSLRDWINSPVNMYRSELRSILYPIFIQCFLDLIERGTALEGRKFLSTHRHEHSIDHQTDIDQLLMNVIKPEHIKENEIAKSYRNNPYNISLCHYSFEILMAYLREKQFMLLLSIIRYYLHITVVSGIDPQLYIPEETIDVETQNIMGSFIVTSKFQIQEAETDISSPLKEELQELEELRNKIILSKRKEIALPSVAFYTFYNTYNGLNCAQLSNGGEFIASGLSDSTIKLWDFNPENLNVMKSKCNNSNLSQKVNTLIGHSGPIYALSFSLNSQHMLSCSQDTTVRLWNTFTKTNIACYRGHAFPIWDGEYFATASYDKTSRLWLMNKHSAVRIFAGHLSDVTTLEFHPNSNYIITGSADKSLRLFDVNSGDCVRVLTGHYATIYSISPSIDGRLVASAGEDKDIILWDLGSSKHVATFKSHDDTIWSLTQGKCGNILASGSNDGSIRIWDIRMIREDVTRKEKLDSDDSMMKVEEDDNFSNLEIESISNPMLKAINTKLSPIYSLKFTNKNMLVGCGPYKQFKLLNPQKF